MLNPDQYKFDLYPLVFRTNKTVKFTLKSIASLKFMNGEFEIRITRMDAGVPGYTSFRDNMTIFTVIPSEKGVMNFSFRAPAEGEYMVRLFKDEKSIADLSIYALDKDLAKRIPYKGDFHIHTRFSDGKEEPQIVCANYRALGYDFITITDHRRYYPSLLAIKYFKNLKTGLTILPGEEIHLKYNFQHIVNAGADYSVAGLFSDSSNYIETNGSLAGRRLNPSVKPPKIFSDEEYDKEIDKIISERNDYPEIFDKKAYASCVFAARLINQGNGLSIFVHPHWRHYNWHTPDQFTEYVFDHAPFSAFEVLGGGGSKRYESTGLQESLYYEQYKKGRVLSIVSSTDSHSSICTNPNYAICSTIVFAEKNERLSIIDAVKRKYSVAVNTISAEYRLVGEYRFQKYATFLMERFYPLHDRLTAFVGEMMRLYYLEEATEKDIEVAEKKVEELFIKYFDNYKEINK